MSWRHAIGEVVLIVVGVTIALAANSWYAGRQERADELEVLEQILTSLEADLRTFEATYAAQSEKAQQLTLLRDHMRMKLPYSESLDAQFGAIADWDTARLNVAPFESLRSRGFDLVSNGDLRVELVDLYDQEHAEIETQNNTMRNQILSFIENYQLEHFHDLDFGTATPNNYDALLQDQLFDSHLDYLTYVLRRYYMPIYRRVIEKMEGVVTALREELGQMS
jgi:hypothetical protein